MAGTPRTDDTYPPHLVERVWAYFAAFLPPAAVDGAVDETLADADFWGDDDEVQVLRAAHAVLTSRIRVAADVEVLVLVEDLELDVDRAAEVVDLPPARVSALLDEAYAILAGPESAAPAPTPPPETTATPPASPETSEPEPRLADRIGIEREVEGSGAAAATPPVQIGRTPPAADGSPTAPAPAPARPGVSAKTLAIVAAVVLFAVVVLLLVLGGGDGDGGGDGTAATACDETAPVCITEAVLTDTVDSLGMPGTPTDTFGLGDDVKLWMQYDRNTDGAITLDVRWSRDGTTLYQTDFSLASNDRVTVGLAKLFMEEPGDYGVEVLAGDTVLVARDFAVTG